MSPGANFQSMTMHGTPFVPISLTYVASPAVDTANNTTYSFAGASIGTADATRRVIVAVAYTAAAAIRTLNSATIAGVSATIHIQAINGSGIVHAGCALISALVPTGTTATVELTFSSTMTACGISIYRQVGEHSSSPHSVDEDITLSAAEDDFDMTISTPGSGALVAAGIVAVSGGTPTSQSWTNATEDFESAAFETLHQYSTASQTNLSAQASYTVSVAMTTSTGTGMGAGVAMSWL